MIKSRFNILFFLAIILVGLITACSAAATSPPTPSNPSPPTLAPDTLALGETVYAANCADCHGANLEGEADWKQQNPDGTFRAPPHDESGHTWHHDDAMLLDSIRLGGSRFDGVDIGGTSEMPAFGETLTEAEMTAVLDYIKSFWPEDIRQVQWQQTLQVQQNQE